MNLVLIFVTTMFLVACSDKSNDAHAEREKHLHDMYKIPPKSDRSKDKGF